MSSNNNPGKGNKGGNSGRRGPPPWAGPPDHVTESEDGTVQVGRSAAEKAQEQAVNGGTQLDRIEAKLDLLLDALDVGQEGNQ
jgi:hypothetical protein